jgi:hypothetical protein
MTTSVGRDADTAYCSATSDVMSAALASTMAQ